MYQTALVGSVRLINPKDRSLAATAATPPPVSPPPRLERVTTQLVILAPAATAAQLPASLYYEHKPPEFDCGYNCEVSVKYIK